MTVPARVSDTLLVLNLAEGVSLRFWLCSLQFLTSNFQPVWQSRPRLGGFPIEHARHLLWSAVICPCRDPRAPQITIHQSLLINYDSFTSSKSRITNCRSIAEAGHRAERTASGWRARGCLKPSTGTRSCRMRSLFRLHPSCLAPTFRSRRNRYLSGE